MIPENPDAAREHELEREGGDAHRDRRYHLEAQRIYDNPKRRVRAIRNSLSVH